MERPDGNSVFIDTTAFYALLDPTREAHAQVGSAWDELLRSGAPLFTSNYVCAELLALVQAGLGFEKARAFLGEVRPRVTVLTVDSELHAQAFARGRRDLSALIPRTSRALMRHLGVTTVFTLDSRLVGPDFRKVEIGQRTAQQPAEHGPEPSRGSATTPRRQPRRHGARRSSRATVAVPSAANRPAPPPARPELICRRALGSWQWEVVLLAPDECNVTGVRLDDTRLRAERAEYRVSSFAGVLSVDHADGNSTEIELCAPLAPMIFKLADRWSGVGGRIDAVSRGHFIVVAPTGWNRRGRASVAPEASVDPAFQAHYFFRNGDPSADGVGFEECDLALAHAAFSLIGERVYDDSTEGELFIGSPPELSPGQGVTWARVGEEKDGGWRGANFLPAERPLAEVLDRRQGRFFVRVYDSSTKLCDNGELRYVDSLREILVDGKPYTRESLLPPESEGHTPIKVQFVGEESAAIRPSLSPNAHHRWVEEEGAIVVEPHPVADEVACSLETLSDSVDVLIRLPRIWWCLGRDGVESAAWCATPLAMTRDEFRDHANADGMVRIRLPREINAVDVGFNHDLSRSYRSTLMEDLTRIVELPLIDFADDSQIDSWLHEDALLQVGCRSCVGSHLTEQEHEHRTPWDTPCSGTLRHFSLGHELVTDVVRLQVPHLNGEWTAYSVGYALLLGAAERLGGPDTDLNVTIAGVDASATAASTTASIVLYDNVPGGAGLVAQLEREDVFAAVLRHARDRVSSACGCDSSCYGCLRSYRNQFAHPHLDRKEALEILSISASS